MISILKNKIPCCELFFSLAEDLGFKYLNNEDIVHILNEREVEVLWEIYTEEFARLFPSS